jgi:hypothetical protein
MAGEKLFRVDIDISALAEKLNTSITAIQTRLQPGIAAIAAGTYGKVIQKAQDQLTGYEKNFFLTPSESANGDDPYKFIKFQKISDNMYVVYITPEVRYIEEGRPKTSMATPEWLLKPGKTKTAKDGSVYRSIPFNKGRATEGKGSPSPGGMAMFGNANSIGFNKMGKAGKNTPGMQKMIDDAAKTQGIKLKGKSAFEYNSDGTPKLGVLHKLNIPEPDRRASDFFSNPITGAESAASGLKARPGVFKLKGAVVTQRVGQNGKVVREVMIFRTVSSKHRFTDKWMYPAVPAANIMDQVYDEVLVEIDSLVKQVSTTIDKA